MAPAATFALEHHHPVLDVDELLGLEDHLLPLLAVVGHELRHALGPARHGALRETADRPVQLDVGMQQGSERRPGGQIRQLPVARRLPELGVEAADDLDVLPGHV